MKFLIVGCARDVDSVIQKEISTLFGAFTAFGQVVFFIVESDSTDSTVEVLAQLSDRYENFHYKSLGKVSGLLPDRHERMAYCRNAYVDHIRKLPAQEFPDFVVVADLDGVNSHLNPEAIVSCFERTDWDACMANQGRNYYDVFALRTKQWCPDDPWKEMWHLRTLGVKELKSKELGIHKKQIVLKPNSPWIPVSSAFGGLAIYKAELFRISRYSSLDPRGGSTICEHVPFNEELYHQGKSMFINPRLINSHWNEHNSIHKLLPKLRRKLALIKESFFA